MLSTAYGPSRPAIYTPQRGDYVSDRVADGQYGNVSEYFRDLIRREQERRGALAELRALIDEADAGGVSRRSVDEIWAEGEQRYRDRTG